MMTTTIKQADQAVLLLKPKGLPRKFYRCPEVSVDQILSAAQRDDNTGICVCCGHEQGETEPDARQYWCQNPDCRTNGVFGAEELITRLYIAE